MKKIIDVTYDLQKNRQKKESRKFTLRGTLFNFNGYLPLLELVPGVVAVTGCCLNRSLN